MRFAHSVAEVVAVEEQRHAELPPGVLMQRAATGLARVCTSVLRQQVVRVYGSRIVLLVGKGNNGADALWAGVLLAGRGVAVTALTVGEPVEDAAAALRAVGRVVPFTGTVPDADLVVDGLLGIGARGPLREPYAAVLAAVPEAPPLVAVDVPTGVDADTGEAHPGAVVADVTVTFGTLKPGLLVGAGRRHAGRIELVDIGLGPGPSPIAVLEADDVVTGVAEDDARETDKYGRGVIGIAAGSETYPGAAVLSTGAALAAGAGMVRFVGAPHAAEQVRQRWPEAVVTEARGVAVLDAGRVQAWVVGPGLGTDASAAETVEAILGTDVPVLVDADALTICAQHRGWLGRSAPTLLTPHDREFERFGHSVGPDRIGAARRLAAELGVTVLLKGSATVVAAPDGRVRVNPTGSPQLATAGSGDVLAGGAGALLALLHEVGDPTVPAAASAAYLHGLAGSLSAAGASTTAERVLAAWPEAVRRVRAERLPP
jgi:hydroxyethylthiazole kinase-like uncharacterized protein yjeF